MQRRAFGYIEKTRSGSYRAYYSHNYKRYYAPGLFPTKTLANTWLSQQQGLIALGAWAPPDKAAPKNQASFYEYATRWVENRKEEGLAEKTIYGYKKEIDKHLTAPLRDIPVGKLLPEHIEDWWNESPATINTKRKIHALFKSILARAVEDKILKENPCQIRAANQAGKKKERFRNTVATPQQVERIAQNLPRQYRIAVTLGFWCALRYGEVAELRRKDIDLGEGTVSISRSVGLVPGKGMLVTPPKTQSGMRTVAIPGKVIQALREHLEQFVDDDPEALLVYSKSDGLKHLRNSSFHKMYNDAVKAACPELGHFDFHSLRHSGLTLFAQAGATVAELQARAGHATPDTVAVYQHATIERDRAIADRMGAEKTGTETTPSGRKRK